MTVRAPPASASPPPSPPSAAVAVAFAERPRDRWSEDDDDSGDAETITIERRLLLVDIAAPPGHDFNAEAATIEEDDKLLLCTAAVRADAKQRASSPREQRMPRP
jgi:hypothetical protein